MEPRRGDSPARKLMAGQKIMERTIILFDCAARDRMHDGGKAEMVGDNRVTRRALVR